MSRKAAFLFKRLCHLMCYYVICRCEDPRNGVIIADFAVQGTLARQLLDSPSHVITRAGAKVRKPRELQPLSGHVRAAAPGLAHRAYPYCIL